MKVPDLLYCPYNVRIGCTVHTINASVLEMKSYLKCITGPKSWQEGFFFKLSSFMYL